MDISYLKKSRQQGRALLAFTGTFSQATLVELSAIIRRQLNSAERAKAVFAVFIEMTQNIMKYSAERENNDDGDHGVGMFLLHEENDCYILSAGNLIGDKQVEALQKTKTFIKPLDRRRATELLKERRKRQLPEDSKGAGLGFLEIVRYAAVTPDFHFDTLDDGRRVFYLTVSIAKTIAS